MNQELDQSAVCTTNSFGRLLKANRRFCRMFGLEEQDVEWHYMLDFHRNEQDWLQFRESMERHGQVQSYLVRLRHRKGRSFKCLIESERIISEDGRVQFQTSIHKVEALSPSVHSIASQVQHSGESLVYLTACHECGKVKDAQGKWLTPMRPVAKAAHRKPSYCPECSLQLFPGLLDPQNWEPAIAMAH